MRMYNRIGTVIDKDQLENFKNRSTYLFEIIANILDCNRAKFFCFRVLSSMAGKTNNDLTLSYVIQIQKEEIVSQFNDFVWSKVQRQMGRPSESVTDYVKESTDKIYQWEIELAKDISEQKRVRLRNNISAQKSRMAAKLKSAKDASMMRFTGYQSNFKLLVNMMSKVIC